jgi:hypothetical protein
MGRFALAGASGPIAEVESDAAHSVPQDIHILRDKSLLIDRKTSGIKNIVVFARNVPRVHESQVRSGADPVELDQKDHCYQPRVLALQLGQPLRIRNCDSTVHIALVRPRLMGVEGRTEVNDLLTPNSQTSFRFWRRESKPLLVKCGFHPEMKAYVLPRDDPYFAVTGEAGSFEIANLPADEEIEFQVWHENAQGASGGLIAKPTWTKGRFRVTIPADGVKDLGTIEVPSSAFEGDNGARSGFRQLQQIGVG